MTSEHTHAHSHTDHEHSHGHDSHDHSHEHDHDHEDHDWSDEDFVASWIERQKERAPERRREFVKVRALIPKTPQQEFRYLNLGAGHGELDELLLDHFKGANAVLVDTSLAMLAAARKRLARFGERVEYVQANLAKEAWTGAVSGPFDIVVSSKAVHHLEEPHLIRELYAAVYRMAGHGGMFLNLDYVRPARPMLAALAPWAAKDPEAGLSGHRPHDDEPGSLAEHLGWLVEAGFGTADVLWKDMNLALMVGVRDHVHMPEEEHGHSHEEHGHGAHAH
jgi:SAM-dependent methyltransferase